ncbi:MAG: cell division protein FtsA [Candidatus Omnitrophica bacterium]|nr:cell division protein FtsA [Candidatus Omnitrophota bacterium]
MQSFLKPRVICAVDIGSRSIKGVVVQCSQFHHQILATSVMPAYGIKDGQVSNLSDLSDTIQTLTKDLKKLSGKTFHDMSLGVGHQLVRLKSTNAVISLIERGVKHITRRDVKHVLNQASLLGMKIGEEILHRIPQNYLVDDSLVVSPIGLTGKKMGVRALLVIAQASKMLNVVKAVSQAGFETQHIHFTPFAAAECHLSDEQKNKGVAYLDMGAKFTTLLMYKDGSLQHIEKYPFGGDDITHNMCQDLNIPFELAETIKLSYSDANDLRATDEEILIKKDEGYKPIKREEVIAAIEPKVQNIVTMVVNHLKQTKHFEELNAGVIMSGSASLLSGLIERINTKVNMPIELVRVSQNGEQGLANPPLFAGALGVACYREKNALEDANKHKHQPWTKQVVERISDLYHEYF